MVTNKAINEGLDLATQCGITLKFLSNQALDIINALSNGNPHIAHAIAAEVAMVTRLTLERRITFAPRQNQPASPETAKGPSDKQESAAPQASCDQTKESVMPKITVQNKEDAGGPSARVQNSNGDTAVIHPGEEYSGDVLSGGSLKVLPATEADVAQEAINRSPKQGAGGSSASQDEPAKAQQDNDQGGGQAAAAEEGKTEEKASA